MQKVIRRAALARNQAKRKARIQAEKDRHDELRLSIQEQARHNRGFLKQAEEERKARREDWLRGPLAPRRHAADRIATFGTIPTQRLHPPKIPKERRQKYFNFAVGDRVCIMRGADQGKIGRILSVNEEAEHVSVEDLNVHDVEYPEFAIQKESDRRPYRSTPIPIPINDVRLVVPLDDPATGQVKDVLVKHLYGGGPILEREPGLNVPRHTRYIAGLDVEIPWPDMEPDEFQDEEIDTLRIDVEEKTYLPSLQEAPFPLSVIDELRNKYSKFRQRHDPEWVEEKQRQDYYEEWKKSKKLVTPKTEFLEQKISERHKKVESMKDEDGNLKMSPQTSQFIQEFMAKQREQNVEA